jgi:threonine dehydrogenase-like Zn-dependent dehydrogenase
VSRRGRVLVYDAPGRLRLDEVAVPDPAPGDALLRVRWCGICGSDLHVFRTGWRVAPGQVLGHEFSAVVVAAPGVAGVEEGDRVVVNPLLGCADGGCRACQAGLEHLCQRRRGVLGLTVPGAFADYVTVPGARLGRELRPIPEGVDDDLAALHEPLAVGRHAFEVAAPVAGEHALVYGAGAIGLGVVHWLAAAGVRTIVVDPVERRRAVALASGADVALAPEDDPAPSLADAWSAGKADLVVDCAGAAPVLEAALKHVRPGGRVTLAAVHTGPDALSSMRVLDKEVAVRGAQAFTVAEHARSVAALPTWSAASSIVSHRFALDDFADAFAAQLDRDASVKVLITPEG